MLFWSRQLDVDETWFSVFYFKMSIFKMIFALARDVFNMPIYYLFMWFWARIVNYNNVGLMIPSVVASIIGVIFVFHAAKKIGGGGAFRTYVSHCVF